MHSNAAQGDTTLNEIQGKRMESRITNLNVEKTPTIISDIARLTSRKFMVVLMVLSLRTTRQTSELPSKLTATMTEQRDMTALENMLTTMEVYSPHTMADAKRKLSCRRKT